MGTSNAGLCVSCGVLSGPSYPLSVAEQRHHGALRALVFRPSVHDRAVVDAVDQHLVDARSLERLLRFQIAGHLNYMRRRRTGK